MGLISSKQQDPEAWGALPAEPYDPAGVPAQLTSTQRVPGLTDIGADTTTFVEIPVEVSPVDPASVEAGTDASDA